MAWKDATAAWRLCGRLKLNVLKICACLQYHVTPIVDATVASWESMTKRREINEFLVHSCFYVRLPHLIGIVKAAFGIKV
jgi:hypothetical protein